METILSRYPELCVAIYDVDYDDYMGVCGEGRPFARLAAVQRILRRFAVTTHFYIDLRKK